MVEVVSKLAKGLIQSPNCSSRKGQKITKITIHHMAGFMSAEECAKYFSRPQRQACANYCIDEKEIWCSCEEGRRAWTSSNGWNDRQAITIECKNSTGAPDWKIADSTYKNLIDLCVDVCKRNGIKKLEFTGDKNGSLTFHYMFAATACPGPWLKSKAQQICDDVNAQLDGVEEPKEENVFQKEIVHYVVKGETLSSIARKYGTTWARIAETNKIKNPNLIYVGQKLIIS